MDCVTYVALLRGINVGGNNKVEMTRLKATFEALGLTDVKSYINSGNIIFVDSRPAKTLVPLLEAAIAEDFGFAVKVLLRDAKNIATVAKALPKHWVNNAATKCDVMFLWESYDSPKVLEQITIKPDIDEVKYVPGAILWRVDKPLVTRSGMMRIAGSELYQHMTIRNANTLRKLHNLMQDS
jgi:uncharacterized protein (DUF1697 family)